MLKTPHIITSIFNYNINQTINLSNAIIIIAQIGLGLNKIGPQVTKNVRPTLFRKVTASRLIYVSQKA